MIALEQKEKIVKMRNEGCSFKLIANTLNLERLQVRDFCRTKTAKVMGLKDNIVVSYQVSYNEPKFYKCENCGREYTKISSDINSTTHCSKSCKEQVKAKRIKAKKKQCLKCKKVFMPKSGSQKYCSEKCRTITLNCEVCGKDFKRPNKQTFRNQRTCSMKCSSTIASKTHEEFYKEFSLVHKGLLVPVELYTKADNELKCYCLLCKGYTTRVADKFINKRKQGCKHCGRKYSNGESVIEEYLIDKGLIFEKQFTFDQLVSDKGFDLRFDFAVFNGDGTLKLLIEFDGRQHFEPVEQFGGQEYYEEVKRSDELKNEHCKENQINLIRISYKQTENIIEILEKMEW